MRTKIASCLLAGALVLTAACGGDDDDDATEASGGTTTTQATESGGAPSEAAGPLTTASTDLGDVLVNADGMTVYVFTNDTDGVTTCTDACAETWPAVTADSADLPEGLDAAIFSVSEAPDGTFQLAADNQPLYTFSGDTAAGDTNGQGIGGAWFAVGPDGNMLKDAAATGGAGGGTTTTMGGSDSGGDDGGY